jgi:hypothetical protein
MRLLELKEYNTVMANVLNVWQRDWMNAIWFLSTIRGSVWLSKQLGNRSA